MKKSELRQLIKEEISKVIKENNDIIYVVDKEQNDEWLEYSDISNNITYHNRPWAKSFNNEEDAIKFANLNPSKYEIEFPDGEVYGWSDDENKWETAFT
jgi:RAB protein geranylgeranyltransferase component A